MYILEANYFSVASANMDVYAIVVMTLVYGQRNHFQHNYPKINIQIMIHDLPMTNQLASLDL